MDTTLANMIRYCDNLKEVRIYTDYDRYLDRDSCRPDAVLKKYDEVPTEFNNRVQVWRVEEVDDYDEAIICVVV